MRREQVILKYRTPSRILHWVHTGAFVALFLTGLVLFIPGISLGAQSSWTRLIHRVAAVVFVVAPAIYVPMNWKATMEAIKQAFQWGSYDIGWLKAAPRYYFLNDESAMPPQGRMNTGERLWWLLIVIFSPIFVATGIILWVFATSSNGGTSALAGGSSLIQWSIFVHDIAFIVTGAMLFVHIYLGSFHPLMGQSWRAMTRGTVTADYARSHHQKWYEQLTGKKQKA